MMEVYATNGEYSLVELTEADKENYFRLLEQVNKIDGFYDDPRHYELMWKVAQNVGTNEFSIYDRNNEYCGNITLNHYDSSTPEIGIDLLEEKRNQGIAAQCIKLLARTVHKSREDIEYFVLRVSSHNPHSKHMIEKLGAVYLGEEETLYKRFVKQLLKERTDESTNEERRARIDAVLQELSTAEDDEVVYRYKLMSSRYL